MDYEYYYTQKNGGFFIDVFCDDISDGFIKLNEAETEWMLETTKREDLVQDSVFHYKVTIKFLKLRGIPLWTSRANQ